MTRLRRSRMAVTGLLALVVVAALTYIGSTVPGMRREPGYHPVWEIGVYHVVAFGSALALLLRAVAVPAARVAWTLLGLGMASYASGTLYFALRLQPLPEIPYPSLSDALWLGFYVAAAAGVLALARHELRQRSSNGPRLVTVLDGLIAGLTVSALAAAFAFDRITEGASGTQAEMVTNFAYPVADLTLLALTASVLVVLGRRAGRQWWLLGLGFIAFTTADTWFLLQIASDAYVAGSPVDATWAVAETALALAAWTGRRPASAAPASARSAVLLPAVCGVAAVAVLAISPFTSVSTVGDLLAAGALLAVLVRMVHALRQAIGATESRHQARTDELTGLPNRRWFYERMQQAAAAERAHVLLIDLDRFKEVNDALGHRTGDHLLRQVAARLDETLGQLPGPHRVARLGGDEFALVVPGGLGEARAVAGQILRVLREPYDVSLMVLHIDGSVGIAELDPADPVRSLTCADIAMYRAKSRRSGLHVYESRSDSDSWDRLAKVEALRAGIHGGELELDFQPLLDLTTGQVRSLEALVRWRHAGQGRISPDQFLPLAEHSGLMHDLTVAVLDLALDHAVALREVGLDLPVAVNVSASDLRDLSMPRLVAEGLAARGLDPSALRIEITETLLVTDRERTDPVLAQLRAAGVRLSVDDYGTGYSSLAYLHDLPVNELKVDRIFVQRLLEDDRTATIVRSTIALAHDLGLTVVGEGVETAAQLAWLQEAGADCAQGWFVAAPMSGADSLCWLLDHSSSEGSGEVDEIVAEPITAASS